MAVKLDMAICLRHNAQFNAYIKSFKLFISLNVQYKTPANIYIMKYVRVKHMFISL